MATVQNSGVTCDHCSKPQSELALPLKHCAKCKKGSYCSRDCQKAHWKTHKEICGVIQSGASAPLELDYSLLSKTVNAFNDMPRTEFAPGGMVKNDWHFSIRSTLPEDVLWIVNPGSRFVYVASVGAPPELWAALDAEGRAALVTPMLLNAFVSGMERPDGKHVPSIKAPWRWATNNAALATEVEKKLVEIGVRKDLQGVPVGNEEYDGISEDEWNKFFANVQRRYEAGQSSQNQQARS